MCISGGNLERKEGTKYELLVDRSARRLVIAGWGSCHSKSKIFNGCITDSAKIGRIEYKNREGNILKSGEIRLPGYCSRSQDSRTILKLASGSPFFSGDPDDNVVRSCGLLGRVKLNYNREARQFWPFANVWLDEVWLPRGTHSVNLIAGPGSFSLVHVRIAHRPWIIEKILRILSNQISEANASKDFKSYSHSELSAALGLKHNLSDRLEVRAGQLTKVAMHLINAAYYLEERDRKDKLRQAAELFLEASKNLEQMAPWKSCQYYIQGFVCLIQSGSERIFDIVEEVNSKIKDLSDQFTRHGEAKSPFSFHPLFLKLRHHVGWFYLECAQSATSIPEQIRWLKKADIDFLEMYNMTIKFGQMLSEPLLRFLQERCLILERVYDELDIRRDASESLMQIKHIINNLLKEILSDKGQI
ncbi:MAG: hypothetical protein FVQ85_20075 [Planctomycetes bacterium]|nr:hypothetical protein [Planctomycetota bacterium]